MKFGKTIQARQIPGWGPYYLDYKFLKKIINSLASHRPASEASLLALGIRPSPTPLSDSSSALDSPSLFLSPQIDGTGASAATDDVARTAHEDARQQLELANAQTHMLNLHDEGLDAADLGPLPPGAEPPRDGSISMAGGGVRNQDQDKGESFRAHRAVFFFKLGRELEKINAFYLTKERDLRLRLLTLLNNRKRLLIHLSRSATSSHELLSDAGGESSTAESSRKGVEWQSLEEGWRLFERDLGKLQQFIEINATGFRKILKKWDKRSKSNTKELYLQRQVEVQPCFNREVIAKMADVVAANVLDLEHGSSHLNTSFLNDVPNSLGADHLTFSQTEPDIGQSSSASVLDACSDLEYDLDKITASESSDALQEWLQTVKCRQEQQFDHGRLMRILWRAVEELSEDLLPFVLDMVTLDFTFVDTINGRTPLHEASIVGRMDLVKLCIERGIDIEARDAYDRRPLHYAAMHGNAKLCQYLMERGGNGLSTDMDGYTPLIQAVISGHVECVKIFVAKSAHSLTLGPTSQSNDLIPLTLACQYGHEEVARLLLRHGAKSLPNSEGLYPQHMAARSGHANICRLLIQEGGPDGGGKERHDKYNSWTPLHHAAVGGTPRHFECVRVLVEAGCNVNATDEYGKSAGFYAGWYGQIACLDFLIQSGARLQMTRSPMHNGYMDSLRLGNAVPQSQSLSPNSDNEDENMDAEADLIPSLSLPPPIIPLRMYGHEFLAKRNMVQITLGHPFSEASSENVVSPIKLYNRTDVDGHLGSWSSLKLVMTSKSDVSAIPHSVVLPLADEREIFSFQVDDLNSFALDLSLYPTFGSKVIGRAVVLPSTFQGIRKSGTISVPLLDHNLKNIGEVSFHAHCVKPFEGAQLEIGGRVETYWKSTVAAPTASTSQDHAHQFQPHRPLSISTSSPSMRSVAGTAAPKTAKENKEGGFVTGSSLSGDYIRLVVQVTRDYIPLAYPEWHLPVSGFDIGVGDATMDQCRALAHSQDKELQSRVQALGASATPADWSAAINGSIAALSDVLKFVPQEIGVNLEIRYTSENDAERERLLGVLDLNRAVDAVLHTVYEAAREQAPVALGVDKRNRKVIFSGYDSVLCTHIQFKQPNFAVFYSSSCNVTRATDQALVQAGQDEESLSVREAVKLAKGQNMLGLVLDCRILVAVPHLIQSVRDAGLLLIASGTSDQLAKLREATEGIIHVDGVCSGGIVTLAA